LSKILDKIKFLCLHKLNVIVARFLCLILHYTWETEAPAPVEEKQLATWGTEVPEDLILDEKLLVEALRKVNKNKPF
jgi:hypothetical protein